MCVLPDSVRSTITGLIVAGGLARRMGGVDKGLQLFAGRPLLAHVIDRLAPQVGTVWLNVNHHAEAYATFGCPLIADDLADYAGPLAGVQAGLIRCTTPLLMVTPCDTPFLPHDLVAQLYAMQQKTGALVAVVSTGGRLQSACFLCHRAVLPDLTTFLEAGARKIGRWLEQLGDRVAVVPFEEAAKASGFHNINTLADLEPDALVEKGAYRI